MAGRFAPPPTVRAYARWRLAVLRTMHRRLSARRFAPSPYAGADAPRPHLPLQFHCSCPQPQRWPSMRRRPDPRCANQSTHSVSSERIADFLRVIRICRTRSNRIQEYPQATLVDIYPARVQHFAHLRHPQFLSCCSRSLSRRRLVCPLWSSYTAQVSPKRHRSSPSR